MASARALVSIRPAGSVFPDQADTIKAACSGWDSLWHDMAMENEGLQRAFDRENRTSWIDEEWRNREAGLALLREVWYRTFEQALIIRLPNGRKVTFDPNNEAHILAVASGTTRPKKTVVPKLHVAFFIGPHELADVETERRRFPYVPFWGYREDRTGIPYGVVRDMIPMQDEVNARRRKLLWLLSSKRVIADSDSLDTKYNDFSDLVREVSRPDAVIVTNPSRANANAIRYETDLSLASQQFEVMRDSEDAIQRVAGIYNAMMGRGDQAKSGLAINSLVEQGTNSVADINDNYRYAASLVGELLLDLLIEDMAGEEAIKVRLEKSGQVHEVILNQPAVDPITGMTYKKNDVTRVSLKVALSDIPSTSSYRQQQMSQIAEVLKSLPPQVQAPLIPYFLESTDLPDRKEMAQLVRKTLGLSEEDQPQIPPELQAQIQQGQQMIQEQQAQLQKLADELEKAKRMEQAKLQEIQANAALDSERLRFERERFEFEKLLKAADMKIKAGSKQQAQSTAQGVGHA